MLYPLVESTLPEEVLRTLQRARNQMAIHQQYDSTEGDDLSYKIESGKLTGESKYNNVQIGIADLTDGIYCLRQPRKI